MNAPFRSRVIGRVLQAPVPGFEHVAVGSELDDDTVDAMIVSGVRAIYVRSVLQCLAPHGVCAKCYGRNLGNGRLAHIGDAVGIVAAQSIGEPGTQLTMRTFHTGGIAGAQGDITQGLPRVEGLFEARVPNDKAEISEIDWGVQIVKDPNTNARTVRAVSTNVFFARYPLPARSPNLFNHQD